MSKKGCLCALIVLLSGLLLAGVPNTWPADVFRETFNVREEDVTIDGTDSWKVSVGNLNEAVVKSGTTVSGEGRSLKIVNASLPVVVERSSEYGNLTPAWVELVLKPGLGNQSTLVPGRGIGAVCFDTSGDILVADGSAWVSSGQKFSSDSWYRVLLKLDFSKHLYDVYISPANTTKIPFLPDKQNLHFIDSTLNSISNVGFEGVYSATNPGDTYVDELMVHFMDRIEIVTPVQKFVKNHASGPITFQLQNSNSEPQTAWEDITFDLYTDTETGEFSLDKQNWVPVTQIVMPEGAQQATFYYKDPAEGKPVIGVKETPDKGWRQASQQLNISAEGQSFDVSVTSPQIAGKPFNVQITSKDEEGQVDSFYGGTVEIYAKYVNPDTAARRLAPDNGTGFKEGVLDLVLSYSDCGTIQIIVQDREDATKKGTSGEVLFIPAKFAVTPAGTQQVVSRPFALSVTALAENDEVTPSYLGPAAVNPITVDPVVVTGASLVPVTLEAAQFQSGMAEVTASYNRWGTIHIEVHDAANPAQKGVAEGVFFAPARLKLEVPKPSGRDFYYTGETIEAALSVLDENSRPVPNFHGFIAVTATPELAIPPVYEFTDADNGQKSILFSGTAAGNYTLKAESSAYNLSVESEPIKIKQATVEVISGVAPVGTTEVEIQIIDEQGKRITSENKLVIQILFEEEDPNNSLFLSSPGKPVLFNNGVAKIILGNTQAETVTISPQAGAGFKIKAGTVTFGRVGKSGIGTLMLLESKDDQGLAEEKEKEKK